MPETPRLFLITPPIEDAAAFQPSLAAAVAAADVACVLLRTQARDEGEAKAIVRALAPVVQQAGAALLIESDPRRAARVDADGVHMAGGGAALEEALAALQPAKIVGVGGLASRDEAMLAGEAGVDYLMFGGPGMGDDHDTIVARVAWWAAIFTVPCVGYAHDPGRAGAIAQAGAEFVALCDGFWESDLTATLTAVARAIAPVGEAAR